MRLFRSAHPSPLLMILPHTTVVVLRRALLVMLVLGSAGTVLELLLLKHTDGVWQLIPLVLNGLTLLVLAWFGIARSPASLRALQATMLLCLASGGVGVVQHFLGNIVYASESNPSLAGRELYLEAIMGSTPTLAPGMMVQLALIGLAFAFRHPDLRSTDPYFELPTQRMDP